MKTTLSERGQTAIPAAIRDKFGLKPGQQIEWIEDGRMIHILPVPDNPVAAFRGRSKGMGAALLKQRQKERERENARKK